MKRTISTIICAVMILSCIVVATGCGKTTQKVDLSKYVEIEGFSTQAYLDTYPDYLKCDEERDAIAEKRQALKSKDDSKYDEYTEKIAELTDLKNALRNMEFSLVKGENGKIKNGDTITVKAKYKESQLKNYGISIESDVFTVKVSGLEEKKVIDPFDEKKFKMETSGIDGAGYVSGEYKPASGEPDVYYTFEPNNKLKNGDEVTITAKIYDSDYILKNSSDDEGQEVTKEITISDLGTIPEKLEGVDTSYADELYLEGIKDEDEIEKNDKCKGYEIGISDINYSYSEIQVTAVGDFKAGNGIYGYNDKKDNKDCMYGKVYSREVTVKMIDPSYSSKVKKGASKKFTMYYIGYESGGHFMVTPDNKLDRITYDYDMYYSTGVADTYKEVKEKMTKYKTDYTFTEIK